MASVGGENLQSVGVDLEVRRPTAPTFAAVRARVHGGTWAFITLLLVLGFSFQGTRGIMEPDEGRYAVIALNMLTSGDYIVPRLNPDQPHFAKPPLTYWAIASSIAAFGKTEWAVRLPSATAFVFTGIAVAMLGAVLGLRRPNLAGVIWSTTLLPFAGGSVASPDMLLAMFETFAVLGYLEWRTHRRRLGMGLMWLSFGMAFLTKGPPGLLPLLAIIAFELSCRRDSKLGGMFSMAPVLAFVAMSLSWFLYVAVRDPSLWHFFVVSETLDRVGTSFHGRNPGWQGFVNVYGAVLLVGTLPFGPVLIWNRLRESKTLRSRFRQPDLKRFLYLWIGIPFAIFAVSQSRLPLYLLPLSVPFALIVARHFEAHAVSVRVITVTAIGSAIVLLGLRFSAPSWAADRDAHAFAQQLGSAVDLSRFDEIVFVDSARPLYGLAFYTGKEAKWIASSEDSATLCTQLSSDHAPLIVMRQSAVAVIRDRFATCNEARPVLVGQLHEFVLVARAPN